MFIKYIVFKSYTLIFFLFLGCHCITTAHKPQTYAYTETPDNFEQLLNIIASPDPQMRDTIHAEIQKYLDLGGDVNRTGKDNRTMLLAAANKFYDDPLIFDLLLSRGANPNIPTTQGALPINLLIIKHRKGYEYKRLKRLLQQNFVNISARFLGKTPLDFARSQNNAAIITLLEDYEKKHEQQNALIEQSILDNLESLLKKDTFPSQEECFNIARKAIIIHSVAIIKKLIEECRCNPNDITKGFNIIHDAIRAGEKDIVYYLLPKIDIAKLEEHSGFLLLYLAGNRLVNLDKTLPAYIYTSQYQALLRIIEMLLDAGANPKGLADYIDSTNSRYNKDIATYYQEYLRSATSYISKNT